MTTMNAAQIAAHMSVAIDRDRAAGVIPASVHTFAELHDYVDANEYIIDALEAAGWDHDPASDEQAAAANKAMDLINIYLQP